MVKYHEYYTWCPILKDDWDEIQKRKFKAQDSNPKPRTWEEVEELLNNKGGKHMSVEDIEVLNIAVIDDQELIVYWNIQIPLRDTDSYGDKAKVKGIDCEFIQAFIESKGHRTCDTCHWYIVKSIKEVH